MKLRGITMDMCMEARRAYEAGESASSIGQRIGLSHTAVINRIRIAGGEMRSRPEAGKAWTKANDYRGPGISGERHYKWKGGRTRNWSGYVMVLMKDHPRATMGGYVREHILVMERHLGRPLEPGEIVHHKNHIKTDNRVENLAITNRSAHARHHKPRLGTGLTKRNRV